MQDQLLVDGERTVRRYAGAKRLDRLRAEAEQHNLELSQGRVRSGFIEPETLLWAAWKALPDRARAAIADEIVAAFAGRVAEAASADPRLAAAQADPMEAHRHRIHPRLWEALEKGRGASQAVKRELAAWQSRREEYLARRPVFSQTDQRPPWD